MRWFLLTFVMVCSGCFTVGALNQPSSDPSPKVVTVTVDNSNVPGEQYPGETDASPQDNGYPGDDQGENGPLQLGP